MKLNFMILAGALVLLSVVGCVQQPISPNKSEGANASIQDLPPDASCSMYHGSVCVAPVVPKLPDSTCHMYNGSVCVAPIIPSPSFDSP